MKSAENKNNDVTFGRSLCFLAALPVFSDLCPTSMWGEMEQRWPVLQWWEATAEKTGEEEQMARNSRGFFQEGSAFYGSYTNLITRQRGKWASGGREIFINPTSYDEEEGDHLLIAYSAVV